MRKNSNLRTALSVILAFILSIVFTAITIIGDVYIGGINDRVIGGIVPDTNYCEKLMNEYLNNCQSMTIPVGLPENLTDNIVTIEEVRSDVNTSIAKTLRKEKHVINTSVYEQRLRDNIDAYFQGQNIVLSDEQKEELEDYVELIMNEYREEIKLPAVGSISEYYGKLTKILIIAGIALIVFAAFIISLLWKMYKWKGHSLRYIAYSALAAFYMSEIVPIALYMSKFYTRLSIKPEYIYEAVVYIFASFLKTSIRIGFIWLVVLAVIVAEVYISKKSEKKEH